MKIEKVFPRIPILYFFVLPFFIYPLSTVLTVYVCGANESGFKMRLFSCNKNPINETISGCAQLKKTPCKRFSVFVKRKKKMLAHTSLVSLSP